MNADSKLKRWIVLLDKAPFVLFLESTKYIPKSALKTFNLSFADTLTVMTIKPDQDLRKIISATSTLEDPLAYNIIDALATNTSLSDGRFFPKHYFTANDWQRCVEWQNVDNKPKPAPANSFIITVDKFTHELSITGDANTVLKEKVYEEVISLHSLDPSIPFPQALLKECVINIHDIIVQASIGRTITAMTESKYLSVLKTGHDSFNYINMKKVEKDLRAVLTAANITIEE